MQRLFHDFLSVRIDAARTPDERARRSPYCSVSSAVSVYGSMETVYVLDAPAVVVPVVVKPSANSMSVPKKASYIASEGISVVAQLVMATPVPAVILSAVSVKIIYIIDI